MGLNGKWGQGVGKKMGSRGGGKRNLDFKVFPLFSSIELLIFKFPWLVTLMGEFVQTPRFKMVAFGI